MLEQMGAKIDGGGTSTLTIEGVERLSPTSHVIVPDRIVAGTWAFAAAMTRGDITVRNARPEHLEIALDKLTSTGAVVEVSLSSAISRCSGRALRTVMSPRVMAAANAHVPATMRSGTMT